MASFTDNAKTTWVIDLDAPKIVRIRSELGLDLVGADGSAYEKMVDDPILLFEVLWKLCSKQADDKKIDVDAFAQRITGDAIESATDAMVEAIADFFPKAKRELVRGLAQKTARIRAKGMAAAMKRVGDIKLEAQLVKVMEDQMDSQLKTLLSSATSSAG